MVVARIARTNVYESSLNLMSLAYSPSLARTPLGGYSSARDAFPAHVRRRRRLRGATFRREHIVLAREAVARGELVLGAPWRSQPMASSSCSAAVPRPQPRRLRNRTRMCATGS